MKFNYLTSTPELIQYLNTDLLQGLSGKVAQERLKQFGSNKLPLGGQRNRFKILLDQFLNPISLLLLLAIATSLGIGHFTDAVIILAIVFLNTGIGFFQENKAEKAIQSIRQLSVPLARVLREGKIEQIPAQFLVPGDIVLLEAGDRVPVDLRFFEVTGLQIDESFLTGESLAVYKNSSDLEGEKSLGDQINMGFMGTHVVNGRGRGLCIATGLSSELGKITTLVSQEKAGQVPLRQRMESLTRWLIVASAFLCALIFILGLLRGEPWTEMLLTAVALGIAAIPEGLPALVTISLSLGAYRLAQKGALVRQLQAVEALGSVTVIAVDKTGTLTENKMQVTHYYVNDQVQSASHPQSLPAEFLQALTLCNDAYLSDEGKDERGDPMEVAFLRFVLSQKESILQLRKAWPRVFEIAFDGERKRMTTLHENSSQKIAFMKGAPELVLPLCNAEWTNSEMVILSPERREKIQGIQKEIASQGLRLLAFAMKELSPQESSVTEEKMIFLGLVALQDPPREGVREAIEDCFQAGIRPVMITGDHSSTAQAIGRQIGLFREGDQVITGAELKQKGSSLIDEIERISIFARVSPEDKLAIVKTLKEKNNFVAMTGDGVNDAPALKKADVGIAMGRGTDVAKESAQIILMDENFSSIVKAIREGRIIYDNIRKFIRYILTTNLGEIATLFFALVFNFPTPLLPLQILWINLVSDGLPAIALGFEPPEGNVLKRPPRKTQESILGQGLWIHILWVGTFMGLITLGVMAWTYKHSNNLNLARTMSFTTLAFCQMAHVLAIRSETYPLWKIGLFSNSKLFGAVFLTLFSQIFLLYFPPLRVLFHLEALSLLHLGICFGSAMLIYFVVEIEKKWKQHHA